MSNNEHNPYEQVRSGDKYDYLNDMDKNKLQALLQQESLFSDECMDVGLIQRIVMLLDQDAHVFEDFDVEASLQSFKENLVPELENETDPAAVRQEVPVIYRKRSRLKTIAAIAAAMIVILMGSTLAANAMGYDLWEYVIHWGKETFQIGSKVEPEGPAASNTETGTNSFQTVEEAVQHLDAAILTPSWLPSDYELTQVSVLEVPGMRTMSAIYQAGDHILTFNVDLYDDVNTASIIFEKNGESDKDVLVIKGIEHYLMMNTEQRLAVWNIDNMVYSVSGDLTEEEMHQFLNSIYERN